MKEVRNPANKLATAAASIPASAISNISSSIAPPKTGSTIKNEKWAAFSRLMPLNKLTDMVDPDRLIPGMMASACATPINKPRPVLTSFVGLAMNLVEKSMVPVTSNIQETMKGFKNSASTDSFMVNPTIPAGIILIKII